MFENIEASLPEVWVKLMHSKFMFFDTSRRVLINELLTRREYSPACISLLLTEADTIELFTMTSTEEENNEIRSFFRSLGSFEYNCNATHSLVPPDFRGLGPLYSFYSKEHKMSIVVSKQPPMPDEGTTKYVDMSDVWVVAKPLIVDYLEVIADIVMIEQSLFNNMLYAQVGPNISSMLKLAFMQAVTTVRQKSQPKEKKKFETHTNPESTKRTRVHTRSANKPYVKP